MVQEIVGTARIEEGADVGGNDRQVQLAWAAGLFDGEGFIHISARKPFGKNKSVAYAMMLGIAMTEQEPLEKFQDIFGSGSISQTSEVNEKYNPAWRYELYATKAANALREMMPHFSGKRRERARIAIEFQNLKDQHYRPSIKPGVMERLRQYREEMLKLNHRGRAGR